MTGLNSYASEMGTRHRLDDQAAWTAVLTRDGQQDGQFVYAVTSTGIYCRPSCPSRRPRREHVAFYATPDAAEGAGFRACLRCTPRASQAPSLAAIDKARAYLDAHLEEGVGLHELSAATGMSLFHLQRRFKQVTGLTPRQYVAARRSERFKSELKQGRSVTEATYEAGYGSSSRVYESSNATLGMTPSAYRRGGEGVEIRYTTTDSPFGRLLVGVTDRGICSVLLGEDDEALERLLTAEYPLAQRERATSDLARTVDDLLARLDGAKTRRDLPLDLQATDFTWRVWRALQEIPYGETRTYGEIARAIGSPKAVRAVAHACASNPAALVIPCHRVIGSTGALTGYRWGLERKRQILAHESRHDGTRSEPMREGAAEKPADAR